MILIKSRVFKIFLYKPTCFSYYLLLLLLFLEHIEGRKDPVGACTAHVRVCGAGVGIFLRIRECRIVLLAQGPRIEDEEGRSKGCFQVRDHPLDISYRKWGTVFQNHSVYSIHMYIDLKQIKIDSLNG